MSSAGRLVSVALVLSVAASAQFTITPVSNQLPTGVRGANYSVQFAVQPAGTFIWSVDQVTPLPPALTLNPASGILSGTPGQTGTFTFTVQASAAAAGVIASKSYTLRVNDPLAITTTGLPSAQAGVAYTASLAATGGQTPYTWTISGTTFPQNGISFNAATGVFTGTPLTAGYIFFQATVADAANPQQSALQSFDIFIAPAPLSIATQALPDGAVGRAYDATLVAAGGFPPFTWSYAFPTGMPPGLQFGSDGRITGTPTQAGTFPVNVTVTDNQETPGFAASVNGAGPARATATGTFQLVIYPQIAIPATTLPTATRGQAYSPVQLQASGGRPPYTWGIDTTGPPYPVAPGVTMAANGTISGTPTATGNTQFSPFVQDSAAGGAQQFASTSVTFRVFDPLTIATTSLPSVLSGTSYSQTLAVSGGEPGYTWAVTSGALPQGVTLSAAGEIAGTPTVPGTYSFQVRASDTRAGGARTATASLTLAVTTPVIDITTASPLPTGVIGTAYSVTFAANPAAANLTWTVSQGSLPAGLTMSPSGVLSGIPGGYGTAAFVVSVSNPANGAQGSKSFVLVINPLPLVVTAPNPLPPATYGVAYSFTLTVTGGVAPYTWTVAGGALPEGLTLSPAGVISGVPRGFGTVNFTARVTDSAGAAAAASKEPLQAAGEAHAQAERLLTLEVRATTLGIATATQLGTIEEGGPYSVAFESTGGVPPYLWTLVSGALPTGLALAPNGMLSGTPLAGRYIFTLRVVDRSNQTATREFVLLVNERRVPLEIITTSMPEGNVGRMYSAVFDARGGARPYTWAISGLPPGVAPDRDGAALGTPTRAGTFAISVQVADSAGAQATATFSLVIRPGTIIIEPAAAPDGIVDTPYSLQTSATGGVPPYRFTLSGTAPPGLTFNNGLLSGTPTEAGTYSVTVEATDEAGQRGQRGYSIVVRPGPLAITTVSAPDGQVGAAYTLSLGATGGLKPYVWSASGLPAGLSLDPATGAISGTPTTQGTFQVAAQVADRNSTTASRTLTVIIRGALVITGSLPSSGLVGTALSGALGVTGGVAPYRWSLATGATPPGTTFSDGSLSGTPSAAGNYAFSVQVTDSTQASVSRAFSIEILGPMTITTQSLPDGTAGAAYSATVGVTGGRAPFRWSASGLPAGLSIGSDGTISGTPTASGTFSAGVSVTDASEPPLSAARTLQLQVGLPPLSSVVLGGVPDAPPPAQQSTLSLSIGAPFPTEIRGTVTMTFAPDAVNNADDPSIQFSTGGRAVAFQIPAGATQAVFPASPLGIQTGTVAGTITLTTAMTSGGNTVSCNCPLTRTIRINRMPPVITSVRVTRTANGFSVIVTGYSTTREISQGVFRFTGTNLGTSEATVALTQAMTQWFQSAAAGPFGGQFVLTMPFTIQGDANSVTSVSVTLSNAAGTSQAVSANF